VGRYNGFFVAPFIEWEFPVHHSLNQHIRKHVGGKIGEGIFLAPESPFHAVTIRTILWRCQPQQPRREFINSTY
jgi:hypothetical protein